MTGRTILEVGSFGSLGAGARYVLDGALRRGHATRLPLGTMAINISGSLMLGFLTGLVAFRHASSALTLMLGAGFCGGFTTFSTASFETVRLAQQRDLAGASLVLGGNLVGAVLAAAAGMALASV